MFFRNAKKLRHSLWFMTDMKENREYDESGTYRVS
jgi:hypothetical protein